MGTIEGKKFSKAQTVVFGAMVKLRVSLHFNGVGDGQVVLDG